MPISPSSPFPAKDEGKNGAPNDNRQRIDYDGNVVGVDRDGKKSGKRRYRDQSKKNLFSLRTTESSAALGIN